MPEEHKWDADIENIVRKYALQNSLEYNGEGKAGSVLGRIMSERKDLRQQAKVLKNYVEEEVEKANNLAKNIFILVSYTLKFYFNNLSVHLYDFIKNF